MRRSRQGSGWTSSSTLPTSSKRCGGRRWLAQAEKALTAFLYARGAEHVLGYSVADLAAECAKLDEAFLPVTARASPLDQFHLPTRYPNTLPGGLPAHAFVRPDAERALDLAREVIAVVTRRLG